MPPHEDSLGIADELARRRQQRATNSPETPLRERVRDEARRNARRHAAADRARRRAGAGADTAPPPFDGGGGDVGAA
jgi:hypothetical protein